MTALSLNYRRPTNWLTAVSQSASPQRPRVQVLEERLVQVDPSQMNGAGWERLTDQRMIVALNSNLGLDDDSIEAARSLSVKALNFIRFALASQANPEAPFIVPCPDGSLQVEWHTARIEIEIYFNRNGGVTLWAKDRETGYEIEVKDSEALPHLIRWAPRLVGTPMGMDEERLSAVAA